MAALMFIGIWISPVAIGVLALGVGLELRAALWAVLLVVAACSALAVAAAVRIARSTERRGTLATAQWPVQRQLRAEPVAQVPAAERPAIGPVYNFNFNYPVADAHAAVIRKAIGGTDGRSGHGPADPAG